MSADEELIVRTRQLFPRKGSLPHQLADALEVLLPKEVQTGSALIAAERERQIKAEGYDAEHDKGHAPELISAAMEYEGVARFRLWHGIDARAHQGGWPWAEEFWKPTGDPVRDLTKAGALIAAAIDSLLTPTSTQGEER